MRDFPETIHVIEKGIAKRLHSGVQISISVRGEEFNECIGESAPGLALNDDTPMAWLSAGKPLTAVAIAQCVEEGLLSWSTCVADIVPKFGVQGKELITIEHLLTHTSGIEDLDTGWGELNWNEIIERISQATIKPDWDAGKRAAYVPSSTWFLLGELLSRVRGASYADVIQQQVLDPFGMTNCYCGAQDSGELYLYDRQAGQLQPSVYLEKLHSGVPSPGSSWHGPAAMLRRFYDVLMQAFHGQDGICSHSLIRSLIAPVRVGRFDEVLQHQIDMGRGVILNSQKYGPDTVPYGYGTVVSETAFGHGGAQCSVGFCDPGREYSAVIVANGRPGEGQHQRRFREILAAIEQDLDLVE